MKVKLYTGVKISETNKVDVTVRDFLAAGLKYEYTSYDDDDDVAALYEINYINIPTGLFGYHYSFDKDALGDLISDYEEGLEQ